MKIQTSVASTTSRRLLIALDMGFEKGETSRVVVPASGTEILQSCLSGSGTWTEHRSAGGETATGEGLAYFAPFGGRNPKSRRTVGALDGLLPSLPGMDTEDLFPWPDRDLAVANSVRVRSSLQRADNPRNLLIRSEHFEFYCSALPAIFPHAACLLGWAYTGGVPSLVRQARGIAYSVDPRGRPPLCCVQYRPRKAFRACIPHCPP